MALLRVRIYPDPVLLEKAKPLESFGDKQQKFFDDMIETMYTEDGVGLAAPQVGVSLRVLIMSPQAKRGEEEVIVNPEIYEMSGQQRGAEGCLSFPGLSVEVTRATRIRARYQNRHGEWIDKELKNFPARVLQHELDHVNGKLMIDYLSFMDRQRLFSQQQFV